MNDQRCSLAPFRQGFSRFLMLGVAEPSCACPSTCVLPTPPPNAAQITDKNAQRLLRHLVRRNPASRWDAAKVASCQWFKTSDFQAYRVTG